MSSKRIPLLTGVDNSDFCDISHFNEWPMKKESDDIWEELDETVASFDTNNFLERADKHGKCKERIDLKKMSFARSDSPDCSKIMSSSWNQQKKKQLDYMDSKPQRPTCPHPPVVREAWTATRMVPRRPGHDYGRQVVEQQICRLPSQSAMAVQNVSQGRIGTIDLATADDYDHAPMEKVGKGGAPWRHIKNASGVRGEQFVYLDGSVKVRERCCFGAGYSPFADGAGDLASAGCVGGRVCKYLRPDLIQAPKTRTNQYAERARQGFVYWYAEQDRPQLCVATKRTLKTCK